MIQKLEAWSLPSLEKLDERANAIYELFLSTLKEVRQEVNPDAKFTVSGVPPYCEVFIVGNKKAGSEYELNCWKTVPVYSCQKNRFTASHDSAPNGYYLNLYAFSDYSSENWRLSQQDFADKFSKVLRKSISDFTVNDKDTL